MNAQYLAGFIDGEGCLRISGSTPYVSLTNKSLPVLLEIQAYYGGNVRHSGGGAFRFEAHGQTALHILEDVIPHLKEKGPQAQLVTQFRDTVPGSHERKMIVKILADLKTVDYGGHYEE